MWPLSLDARVQAVCPVDHTEPCQDCLPSLVVTSDYKLLGGHAWSTFLGSESIVLRALLQFSVSTSPEVGSFVGWFVGTIATELGLPCFCAGITPWLQDQVVAGNTSPCYV